MTELVSQSITNMQNGVSQQTPALRYSSQCEEQLNCRNDPVDGMGKRQNTTYKGVVAATGLENYHIGTVERDGLEKYKIMAKSDAVKVIDAESGYEYPVVVQGTLLDYLALPAGTTPSEAFQLLNTIDTTFILNRTIPVKRVIETTPARKPEALWYVKQADYKVKYTVTINGYTATIETPEATTDRARAGLNTTGMTTNMKNAINALNTSHGCTAVQAGNILHITADNGSDFTITAHDDLGDRASYAIKSWVSEFSQLPPNAVEGFRIEIRGKAGDIDVDPYHVMYTELDADGNTTAGVWEETLKHGLDKQIDTTTTPLALTRTQDAGNITAGNPLGITFILDAMALQERTVGDDETAPFPSFVSIYENGVLTSPRHIQSMLFHKNRLCFISDENLIFSETGEYMNFFPTTVVTELDSDPIDVALNLNSVAPVRYALVNNGELFLFAPELQLRVTSGEVFNAASLDVAVISSYQMDEAVAPFVSGSVIHFWSRGKNYSTLYEFVPQGDSTRYTALEVTAHVPRYIEGQVRKTLSVHSEGMLFTLVKDDADNYVNYLYVANILMQGQERVQNAWQKWTFTGTVIDIDVDQDVLSLVMKYDDGYYLEEMILSHDPLFQEVGHPVFLDRREEVDVNFTLPGGDQRVIFDHGGRYWVGFRYQQKYTFSEFFMRQDEKAVIGGRLQLRYLTLQYHNSTEFVVTVEREGVDQRVKTFDGRVLDSVGNILGQIPVIAGTERFPIHTRSDRAIITITNDTETDALFQTAEWEGTYTRRNRRT